jgi:hypothetical protein
MTYMYRFKLRKGDDLDYLLEDDFPSPMEMNEPALKTASIRELNKKIGAGSYPEYDKFNNVIDYSLEVYKHIVGKPAFTGNPVVAIPLYLVDSKFYEKPELNFNIA